MGRKLKVLYDCEACTAYCCSYPRIIVTESDIARLGERFGLSPEEARRKLTKAGYEDGERVLRHRRDRIFGSACQFLDRKTRRCTVYEHRPEVCRDFPGQRRCGYYDFLTFERRVQEDPDLVVRASVELS